MELHLDKFGRIAEGTPEVFFRVETWLTGMRLADFTTEAEASAFAIADAAAKRCRYDHKVSCIVIAQARGQ